MQRGRHVSMYLETINGGVSKKKEHQLSEGECKCSHQRQGEETTPERGWISPINLPKVRKKKEKKLESETLPLESEVFLQGKRELLKKPQQTSAPKGKS